MIFISVPYSDPDPAVVAHRVEIIHKYAGQLIERGRTVMSPVIIGNAVLKYKPELPTDYTFWKTFSLEALEACDDVHVLCLPGWDESVGVQDEIRHARLKGKNVILIASVHGLF